MDVAAIYQASAERLVALARELDGAALALPVAATPPWSVADAIGHLAGVAEDMLAGNLAGAGGEAWTAAQVERNAGRPIGAVCEEWLERVPGIVAMVGALGPAGGFLAFDVWTHEQDIRATVGVGAVADDELVAALAALAVGSFERPYEIALDGAPAAGDRDLVLLTTGFDLLRSVFGRRTRSQLEALAWSGLGAAEAAAGLSIFPLPVEELPA